MNRVSATAETVAGHTLTRIIVGSEVASKRRERFRGMASTIAAWMSEAAAENAKDGILACNLSALDLVAKYHRASMTSFERCDG